MHLQKTNDFRISPIWIPVPLVLKSTAAATSSTAGSDVTGRSGGSGSTGGSNGARLEQSQGQRRERSATVQEGGGGRGHCLLVKAGSGNASRTTQVAHDSRSPKNNFEFSSWTEIFLIR